MQCDNIRKGLFYCKVQIYLLVSNMSNVLKKHNNGCMLVFTLSNFHDDNGGLLAWHC